MANKPVVRYTAERDTTVFPFDFNVPNESWVHVEWLRPTDAITQEVPTIAYYIELSSRGGKVVFKNSPPAGTIITIVPQDPSVEKPMVQADNTQALVQLINNSGQLQIEAAKYKNELDAVYEKCKAVAAEIVDKDKDFINNTSKIYNDINILVSTALEKYTAEIQSKIAVEFDNFNHASRKATALAIEAYEDSVNTIKINHAENLAELQETSGKDLALIKQVGSDKLADIREAYEDYSKKLIDIFQNKYEKIHAFNVQVDSVVKSAETNSTEQIIQVYNKFKAEVEATEREINASLVASVAAIQEACDKAVLDIKNTGDRACAELNEIQESLRNCISAACAYAEQAAKYKDEAYSAAGIKGWLVYRKTMPTTEAEIKELQTVINDGGLVIAAGVNPEDGGGNPTGGTDTRDFWCMVKTVEAYQKTVEELLGNLQPEDLANLHEYFDYLSSILAKLEKQEYDIKSLDTLVDSLRQRLKLAEQQIATIISHDELQDASIVEIQTTIVTLTTAIDKKFDEVVDSFTTRVNALSEEHKRLGFLYNQLDKRVTALEGANGA